MRHIPCSMPVYLGAVEPEPDAWSWRRTLAASTGSVSISATPAPTPAQKKRCSGVEVAASAAEAIHDNEEGGRALSRPESAAMTMRSRESARASGRLRPDSESERVSQASTRRFASGLHMRGVSCAGSRSACVCHQRLARPARGMQGGGGGTHSWSEAHLGRTPRRSACVALVCN